MFKIITHILSTIVCVIGLIACLASPLAAQEFRVTEAVLKPDNAQMSGPCPLKVIFNGYITANGPGTIKYTFMRSDGARGPYFTIEFKAAGTQTVSTDWTLGDASVLPRYRGWQSLKIVFPNEVESAHDAGAFVVNCEHTPAPQDSKSQIFIPVPDRQPRPKSAPVDADGNPRTNDGPAQPVNPLRARYRVTLNGFKVNHWTYHGLFQRPDAVTFNPKVGQVNADETRATAFISSGDTNTIGMTPENQVQGGTSSANGGLQTGDGFPTSTPWRRTLPRSSAPLTTPPTIYFEGEIVQNTDAAWIIPNIWSVDGWRNLDLKGVYDRQIQQDLDSLAKEVRRIIHGPQPLALTSYLRAGNSMGLNNTMSLDFGIPQNRPIGMQPIPGNHFGFTPQVLVLTYDSADYLSRTDFGLGRGIIPVRYVDHLSLAADYTLYFQVERLDTLPPCPESISDSSVSGTTELRTTHFLAPGPYLADINLMVSFTDCGGAVRITNFPPLTTEPFPVGTLQNRTTVTMTGGGTGTLDRVTGQMQIPITLHFRHSVEAALGFASPSDINLVLTTEETGGQRLSNGSFVLVGSGQFMSGFLRGRTGTLVVTGTLSPRP